MRPGRSCVCRLVATRTRGLESEFQRAIRETKFQLTDREKGGPGALERDPPNRISRSKSWIGRDRGSWEKVSEYAVDICRVRGRRYLK